MGCYHNVDVARADENNDPAPENGEVVEIAEDAIEVTDAM